MSDLGLIEFLQKIWKNTPGAVRLATKDKDLTFANQLFSWPSQEAEIVSFIQDKTLQHKEVFFSPDIYKPEALTDRKATKPYVLGSHVICLDFDGNAPQEDIWYLDNDIPLPSIKIQSSSPANQHVYWVVDELITDIPALENMRKTLTYRSKADGSGWDAGQLLRPPYTINHGYGKDWRHTQHDVIIEELTDRSYGSDKFPTPKDYRPLVGASIDKDTLPSVARVLADNTFVEGFIEAFLKDTNEVPKGTRSDTLMAIGYYCTESGLNDSETFAMVQDADTRWGVYVNRTPESRYKRLVDIVERARGKYPTGAIEIRFIDSGEAEISPKSHYSIGELVKLDRKIEWFFKDLLSTRGSGILAGHPGVGKTQVALRLGESVAMGTDFLSWENIKGSPGKVLFMSLEMDIDPLVYFIKQMGMNYDLLEPFFTIFPEGFTLPLDSKEGRARFERELNEVKPDLVIIDSSSKTINKSLSDDVTVLALNNYYKQMQRQHDCAIVTIHHSRKASGNRQVGELDDLYGSRFIGADADFVISFNATKEDTNLITVTSSKMRLGPTSAPFNIHRNPDLSFELAGDEPVPGGYPAIDTGSWAP